MEVLLSRVTQQAVSYAIRSGISISTGYALKECGRLLKQAPRGKEREELMQLQLRLESKISVISPSIDMIELIAARGNTSLESAVKLCKTIRYEIQKLGSRMNKAAARQELLPCGNTRARSRQETDNELKAIIDQTRLLLARIEDAVPLINLAITTSGVNLTTKLSGTISPSRLLQASAFLTAADTKFTSYPHFRQQVGPAYLLRLYMLFTGHASRPVDEKGVRATTWKQVVHKARVKLWRVPLNQLYMCPGDRADTVNTDHDTIHADAKASEFGYQLTIVEDLDDGLVHTYEDNEPQPGLFDDVPNAGVREVIPIHEISKVFYADTGKILNIGGDGEATNPVLLLKRDVHAEPPRRMVQHVHSRATTPHHEDEQEEVDGPSAQLERESEAGTPRKDGNARDREHIDSWRLPSNLEPEWLAFEVFTNEEDSDTDDEETPPDSRQPPYGRSASVDMTGLGDALANLNVDSSPLSGASGHNSRALALSPNKRSGPSIKTTLSLLEMLLKLSALQQFRQESHLAIEDELLNFFLEDNATAGAGADKDYRQRIRHEAITRVGFDPYDESPIKHRGEEYLRDRNGAFSPRGSPVPDIYGIGNGNDLAYDEAYEHDGVRDRSPLPKLDFNNQQRLSPRGGTNAVKWSPLSTIYQRTPSRTSTPDKKTSDAHRRSVRAKYARGGSDRSSPVVARSSASPPSTTKGRTGVLRKRNEQQRARSPLAEIVAEDDEDE